MEWNFVMCVYLIPLLITFRLVYYDIILKIYFLLTYARWVWAEAGAQTEVEEALNMGGFGYPVSMLK